MDRDSLLSVLPETKPRRARSRWGRGIARALCAVLALIGLVPLLLALIVRSDTVRRWAARETATILAQQGIHARYGVEVSLWPLAIDLTNVHVDATDGRRPFLTSDRVRVRPKVFALLSGKLHIEQVEVESPQVRAVVRKGKLSNLDLKLPESDSTEPTRVPFSVFAVTNAGIDLDIDGTLVHAQNLDVDVSVEDTVTRTQAFEIALHAGSATMQFARLVGAKDKQRIEVDDDALCSISGRVRIDGKNLTVRRFEATGSADLDVADGTNPRCELSDNDKRKVVLGMNRLHVHLPERDGELPTVNGHVLVRAPIALAARAVELPDVDGWVQFDADVRFAEDTTIPDIDGTLEAHGIRLDQYKFARDVKSRIIVRGNLVTSPETVVGIGDGEVKLTDVLVDPLRPGGFVQVKSIAIHDVNFTSLLRDLGIHPNPHVSWDLREVVVAGFTGTFSPLHLDADFTAHTTGFGVYTKPASDPSGERLVGFSEANIVSHYEVRPEGVHFRGARANIGKSHLSGGHVMLGFKGALLANIPDVVVDLDDISPVGPVKMSGIADLSFALGGTFNDPQPSGEIRTVKGFVVSDISFGDILGGKAKVDVHGPRIDLAGIRGQKNSSPYEMPSGVLRFGKGPGGGFTVDALAKSPSLDFRDLLLFFKGIEDDPRFAGISGKIATEDTQVHVALGGPEDTCGGGRVRIQSRAHLTDIKAFDEQFPSGDAEFDFNWYDRLAGMAGAELDVHSFVLKKAPRPNAVVGTVLGSASIRKGGAINASFAVDSMPISQLESLKVSLGVEGSKQVEGLVSAVGQVSGSLNEFAPDAGLDVRAQVEIDSMRLKRVAVPPSHLRVEMHQNMKATASPSGRTGCGMPTGAAFDRAKYLTDTSSKGYFVLEGELFDKQVVIPRLEMSREKDARIKNSHIQLRGLDLSVFSRVAMGANHAEAGGAPPASGELWAQVDIEDLVSTKLDQAKVKVRLGTSVIQKSGQNIRIMATRDPIVVEGNRLVLPEGLEVKLETTSRFSGGLKLSGEARKLTAGDKAELDFKMVVDPIDLAMLSRFSPKIERAQGKFAGDVTVKGTVAAPAIAGTMLLDDGLLQVTGLPATLTDISAEIKFDPTLITALASAKFGSGSISINGAIPVRGPGIGTMDAGVIVRDMRLAPAPGITTTLDAVLNVAFDPNASGTFALPNVTGDVTIKAFEYTRPVNLSTDLSVLGGRARRTVVDHYDPAMDAVVFDVRVTSKVPLRIRNNLADVELKIDSDSLNVTGTNQRFGLRGDLRTQPGGRIRFQASEFDIRQGLIRFDDPTRIAPNVDVTAVTDYRRYGDTSQPTVSSVSSGVTSNTSRGIYRIQLHAYGDSDNLRLDMTSEPTLSQEDIVLLLTVGMTRAELDQLKAASVGANIALNYVGTATGADRAVKEAIPIIDDFRFGSMYSRKTLRTEPQLTIGKRISEDVRASITTGLGEERQLRSDIELRLGRKISVQGSYDNYSTSATGASSSFGNVGLDFRWRLEFD